MDSPVSSGRWMRTVTTVVLAFEAVPIVAVSLPGTAFILLLAVTNGIPKNTPIAGFDLAVMLYPATWIAAAIGAYRLFVEGRNRQALACTLIPIAHMAIAAVGLMVAAARL
jgi:hypothetical protein